MNILDTNLKNEERASLNLRSLYRKYGYTQYKMNKFEEYDLYVKNKDFLISDSVITFTDIGGKLMALKPDVTLSIVKNHRAGGENTKVYYNENVYRVSGGNNSFKEIMQVGLEQIGNIDIYCVFEVLSLAAQSLNTISQNFVLNISNIGIISSLLDGFGLSATLKHDIINCIGKKNIHEVKAICENANISAQNTDILCEIISTYGAPSAVLPKIKALLDKNTDEAVILEFEKITTLLQQSIGTNNIRIDFSVTGDTGYYSGIVFKGFVNGIASSVLSGGQYDNLLQKMGKNCGAIGFAVYLDLLSELEEKTDEYDVDTVILYDERADIAQILSKVEQITKLGFTVTAVKEIPTKLKYRKVIDLGGNEVKNLENNA